MSWTSAPSDWGWPSITRRWAENSIGRDEAFAPSREGARVLVYSQHMLVAVEKMVAACGRSRVSAALRRLADAVEQDRLSELQP